MWSEVPKMWFEVQKNVVCSAEKCGLKCQKKLIFLFLGKPAIPGIFPIKVNLLNLEFINKNIPMVLPISPIKFKSKTVQGFTSYDQTFKQTNKQRLLLYIYLYNKVVFSVCLSVCLFVRSKLRNP